MTLVFAALCAIAILQLAYPTLGILVAQVMGRERLRIKNTPSPEPPPVDYACIITAYRNAAIAKPLVDSLLRQTAPDFIIYLVADECSEIPFTVPDERLVYLQPPLPLRLKVKSIQYAIEHFKRSHEYIVVFDADNLAHPQFLENLTPYVRAGYRCIQGRRTAKNLDSTYAALDSLGEHYKNYIERQTPYMLGGSAVISGSGMATEASLYKAYLASPQITQGQHLWKKMLQEDKILQNFIVKNGERIAYARRAVVYDEKVDSGAAVETQRSRWLFSYFQNLPNAGGILLRGLGRFDFNQVYFGFVTLVLPMFLQVALAAILFTAGLWIAPGLSVALFLAGGIFILGILWALWLDEAPKPVWKALWQAPKFVWRQVISLANMRDPNKNFKHTEHKKTVSVEELLK